MVSTVLRMAGSRPCFRRAYNKEVRGREGEKMAVEGEKMAVEGGKQQWREKKKVRTCYRSFLLNQCTLVLSV